MQPGAWSPKSKGKEKKKRNCTCNLGPGAQKAKKKIRNRTETEHATWSPKNEENETNSVPHPEATSKDKTLPDLENKKRTKDMQKKRN